MGEWEEEGEGLMSWGGRMRVRIGLEREESLCQSSYGQLGERWLRFGLGSRVLLW